MSLTWAGARPCVHRPAVSHLSSQSLRARVASKLRDSPLASASTPDVVDEGHRLSSQAVAAAVFAASFATVPRSLGRVRRCRRQRSLGNRHRSALAATVGRERGVSDERTELRFQVGERVECYIDGWRLGVVVRHWYREPVWPEGQVVPYQVKLDSGMTIFVPVDQEECIRKATGILAYGKIPVTVLTGFLGAGKTTLLNYILGAQHGKKYAVIENEFGDIPIDEMLIDSAVGKQSTMESITVLDNGCLCCTLRDDLVEAIRGIVTTVDERLENGVPDAMIDGIIIETTGVADPGPICKTFELDEIVNATCKIDGIITVVDAVHFLQQLTRERPAEAVNEPAQQVAFADKILLNKVDAVDRSRVAETIGAIREVNTLVPIRECSLANSPDAVPISELLAIDAFDATKLLTEKELVSDIADAHNHGGQDEHALTQEKQCTDPGCSDAAHDHGRGCAHAEDCGDPDCTDPARSQCRSDAKDCNDPTCDDAACGHEHGHSHTPVHAHAHHDLDIGTMLLEMSGSALDVQRFQVFLDQLLSERSADVYRYKGVLAVEQQGVVVRYVLQGVHDMTQISFSGEWPVGVPVKTQVVIIGRKLEEAVWSERFAQCATDAELTVV